MIEKSIKKQIKDVESAEKEAVKARYRAQSTCNHRDHGDPCLTWVESKQNGETKKAYMCQKCKKKISPKAPEVDELMDASSTVETASDYIRMFIPADSDEDIEKLEWHGKLLENLTKLGKSYSKIKDHQAKQKQKNKSRHGSRGNSSFSS